MRKCILCKKTLKKREKLFCKECIKTKSLDSRLKVLIKKNKKTGLHIKKWN